MNFMRWPGKYRLAAVLLVMAMISGCQIAKGDLLAFPDEWAASPSPAASSMDRTPSPVPAASSHIPPTPSPTPAATPTPLPPTPSPIPSPTPAPGAGDYRIIIDESAQVLSVMAPDSDGAYTVIVTQMICSTGSKKGCFPYGAYEIYDKSQWMLSSVQTYFRYACRFNGPYLIHSVTYERIDNHTLIPESYQDLGEPVSAGCIRLSVRDAKWIYDHCSLGTVVDYRDTGGPPVTKLTALPELEIWMDFDPTDPECADIPAPTHAPTPAPSPPRKDDP